jgi:hypothetical protein
MKAHPLAIEQDEAKLLAIRKFTFDINDKQFVEYFIARTGAAITECACGWLKVKALIKNPPDIVWRITRAKLQDCWEIYSTVK